MGTKETMMQMAPDVPFPWTFGEGVRSDCIVDANGDPIALFYGPPKERTQAMQTVIVAVNTLAGYKAEIEAPNVSSAPQWGVTHGTRGNQETK